MHSNGTISVCLEVIPCCQVHSWTISCRTWSLSKAFRANTCSSTTCQTRPFSIRTQAQSILATMMISAGRGHSLKKSCFHQDKTLHTYGNPAVRSFELRCANLPFWSGQANKQSRTHQLMLADTLILFGSPVLWLIASTCIAPGPLTKAKSSCCDVTTWRPIAQYSYCDTIMWASVFD